MIVMADPIAAEASLLAEATLDTLLERWSRGDRERWISCSPASTAIFTRSRFANCITSGKLTPDPN